MHNHIKYTHDYATRSFVCVAQITKLEGLRDVHEFKELFRIAKDARLQSISQQILCVPHGSVHSPVCFFVFSVGKIKFCFKKRTDIGVQSQSLLQCSGCFRWVGLQDKPCRLTL